MFSVPRLEAGHDQSLCCSWLVSIYSHYLLPQFYLGFQLPQSHLRVLCGCSWGNKRFADDGLWCPQHPLIGLCIFESYSYKIVSRNCKHSTFKKQMFVQKKKENEAAEGLWCWLQLFWKIIIILSDCQHRTQRPLWSHLMKSAFLLNCKHAIQIPNPFLSFCICLNE